MRLNPNLRSRNDQDVALQAIRDEEYRQERLAWINRMEREYDGRFYRPSGWATFREYLLFGWWIVKWVVLVGSLVLFGLSAIHVLQTIVNGRL